MKDGLVDRAEVLRIIQEARESGETDLRSIRALVEYLPAAAPPTPADAAMRAAKEIARFIESTSTLKVSKLMVEAFETIIKGENALSETTITRHLASTASPETPVGGDSK